MRIKIPQKRGMWESSGKAGNGDMGTLWGVWSQEGVQVWICWDLGTDGFGS